MKSSLCLRLSALLGAAVLSLAFPFRLPGMSGPCHLSPLVWVGLIPFFLLLRHLSQVTTTVPLSAVRRRWARGPLARGRQVKRPPLWGPFVWGTLVGTVFFLLTLFWVTHSMTHYGGLPWSWSLLVLLLLATYLGIYFGLFALGWVFVTSRVSLPWVFTAPPLWVGLEWLRGHLFLAFPWAALGYAPYDHLSLIQVADLSGVYGVSFLIVAVNAALAEGLSAFLRRHEGTRRDQTGRYSPWISIAVSLALLLMVWLYGVYRLTPPATPAKTLTAAVIQGNIPQNVKWDPAFQRRTMETYYRLTRQAASRGARLIIWPETTTPFFFQDASRYQQEILRLAQQSQASLIFGSPAYRLTETGPRPLNSAYLVSPDRGVLDRYDKIQLVPFGEYVPLSRLLFFINRMVEGIGDFSPGTEYTVLHAREARIGTVICFEILFPELTRRFVSKGADLMVSLTNDAWFGETGGPYQHFAVSVLRAVENRTSFARAANSGVSGFVDPEGHILKTSLLFQEAFLVADIPVRSPAHHPTFYTRYGDWIVYGSLVWIGVLLGAPLLRWGTPPTST